MAVVPETLRYGCTRHAVSARTGIDLGARERDATPCARSTTPVCPVHSTAATTPVCTPPPVQLQPRYAMSGTAMSGTYAILPSLPSLLPSLPLRSTPSSLSRSPPQE
eukprot:2517573-Rhodomonas_salina.1